eukprot:CAMPEP_0204612176 /NCGR_PEP_ID=MMETSP0717-20131115/276_1 /ASSEMBLY_ACC=CAM_ASM_000666 /TAXON_ID=230516 /ORGANISM="Chaetoceros curvisetus" /LENGTH=404 /DNA_ID=CAMNT_0051624149 /DNA_START=83 /DNA_END=1297 /DNA_ORIENTATION=-
MTFGQLSKYTSAMYKQLTAEEKASWASKAEEDKMRYMMEMAQYMPSPGHDAHGNAVDCPIRVQIQNCNIPRKQTRDNGAPKRNLSAYLLYQNAMRDEFKQANPEMSFGQLSKYTSAMYKLLSAEEKAEWEERARVDKERFDIEMSTYTPPPGYDSQGRKIEEKLPIVRKKKKNKDPNAPKRARGSFVLFTNDIRPKIMKEFPATKFTELGTIMGKQWRALDPKEKQKYEEMANQDKIRFKKEMMEYNEQKIKEQDEMISAAAGEEAVIPIAGLQQRNSHRTQVAALAGDTGLESYYQPPMPAMPPVGMDMIADQHQSLSLAAQHQNFAGMQQSHPGFQLMQQLMPQQSATEIPIQMQALPEMYAPSLMQQQFMSMQNMSDVAQAQAQAQAARAYFDQSTQYHYC